MYLPSDPLIWEGVAADPLLRKKAFWVPLLLIGLAVWAQAEGMLTLPAWWLSLQSGLGIWIPSLADWQARSYTPETTGLWFTLCWCVSPYYVILLCRHQAYERQMVCKWQQAGWKRHLLPLLLVGCAAFFLWLTLWVALPAEEQCHFDCIHQSLWLQIFYGVCCYLSLWTLLAMLWFWLKNFRRIHLQSQQATLNDETPPCVI